MLILKLAYRNVKGAGLRTWLKVAVLSFTYVLIVWHYGLLNGMFKQSARVMIDDEIAGGQYWHENYDPYDPMSLDDSHGAIPAKIQNLIKIDKATPVLIRQAAIFPGGRIQSVLLKGIDPAQKILNIPTAKLDTEEDILPVLIGKRMAKSNSLKTGDYIMIRWRDARGTFDAVEGKIVEIMNTYVPAIDSGNLWIPVKDMQKMTCLEDEATMVIVERDLAGQADLPGWKFRGLDFLLKDINDIVKSKKVSGGIIYFILILLAMIAIFDTQILSIFRRRKEIGTLMALGMTRSKVITLFTAEGALIGILAAVAATVYGTPLLWLSATKGLSFPEEMIEGYGIAIPATLFPSYTAGLVMGTVILIMAVTTIVSYLPTRKISKLKPTEALKGKMS